MKKVFIFLSTVLLSCFIVAMIQSQYHQISFSSFNAVDIIGTDATQKVASREEVTNTLNSLANQTNSIIARRITEPNQKGKIKFVYEIYGKGQVPDFLEKATTTSAQTSDLISNYAIVSGKLTSQELADTMRKLGYSAVPFSSYSLLNLLVIILVSDVSLISLVLFLLTFMSLTLIYRIKDLRSAGIRRIAGQDFVTIMKRDFIEDVRVVGVFYLVGGAIGLGSLYYLGILQQLTISLLLFGLALYAGSLLALSLLLSFLYLLGLKSISLVEILKGRLPLKRLLAIMLIGQFLSVIVIGWTVNTAWLRYTEMNLVEKAAKDWDSSSDYHQISYSYSSAFTNDAEREEQDKIWYKTALRAIQDRKALFVNSNVSRYVQSDVADGVRLTDYVPLGNTLYVSPNYLTERKITDDKEFLAKMNSLKEGEFGLILPRKLKDKKDELEKTYTEYMSSFSRGDRSSTNQHLFSTTAYTKLVEDGKERFIYNSDTKTNIQYLHDPIIVVMTPRSMGDTPNSRLYWGVAVGNGLHLRGYQESIDFLKEQNVYHWISYLLNNRTSYYQHLQESRNKFFFLMMGTILGIATSILLFNSMNLIYFEQFRKEIFIKRIAGLRFRELHAKYLIAQVSIFILAVGLLLRLTGNAEISLLTLLLFLVNMMMILVVQNYSEKQVATTVLKGK